MRERILLRIDKGNLHNSFCAFYRHIPRDMLHVFKCVYLCVKSAEIHNLCILEVGFDRAIIHCSSASGCAWLRHSAKRDDNVGVAHALLEVIKSD